MVKHFSEAGGSARVVDNPCRCGFFPEIVSPKEGQEGLNPALNLEQRESDVPYEGLGPGELTESL